MAACRSLTGRYQPIWSPIAAVQRARVAAFPVKCVARRIGHAGLADEIGITSADGGLSCASHHCASVIRSTRDFAAIIRALHGVMPCTHAIAPRSQLERDRRAEIDRMVTVRLLSLHFRTRNRYFLSLIHISEPTRL